MDKRSKKGNSFFIKKTHKRPDDLVTNSFAQYSHKTSTSSGNFFVSPSEKQNILDEKTRRNALKQKKEGEVDARQPKKPFDKKKWRLQKYSKKYKLQQWEEKRRKVVLHEYYKQLKDEAPKFDVKRIYENDEAGTASRHVNKDEETDNENNLNSDIGTRNSEIEDLQTIDKGKGKPFRKARLAFERIREEKTKMQEERIKNKAEKAAMLKQKKQQKIDTFRKLNKKTKKGQPIMKHRMEMLLERIQKTV